MGTKHGLTPVQRLKQKTILTAEGCWEYQGARLRGGYGNFEVVGEKERGAHRWAYMLWVGPIPEGMIVDHECHNRAAEAGTCQPEDLVPHLGCRHHRCCNPAHLVLRTQGENLLASPHTQAAINKAKKECKRGHPFDEENTRIRKTGHRSCKACDRMTPEERRAWDASHEC